MPALILATARDWAVVVTLIYDEATLRVQTLDWTNASGEPLFVMVGSHPFPLAGVSGSVNVPGNRRMRQVEDGLSCDFPVSFRVG